MICGMTLYQICWYFLIYSFAGWVVEVIFHAVTLGKIINRGFLNGPVCPVYGLGILAVFAAVNTIQAGGQSLNGIWIFVFGIVLATAVELIAGWLLDVCFHARWWDYSDKPLNFHGYICLEFSIIWGLAIVFVVRIFQDFIEKNAVEHIPSKYGWAALAVLYIIFLADLIVTVANIRGLNKKLSQLDKISADMRIVSNALSERVGSDSIDAAQRIGSGKVQAALAKAELRSAAEEKRISIRSERNATAEELRQRKAALQARFDELSSSVTRHSLFGTGHLLRAFPNMHHRNYPELVNTLRHNIEDKA